MYGYTGYTGNIPLTMYAILLGCCWMGHLRPAHVCLCLELMDKISLNQLLHANQTAKQHGHDGIGGLLASLAYVKGSAVRGEMDKEGQNKRYKELLHRSLDRGALTSGFP